MTCLLHHFTSRLSKLVSSSWTNKLPRYGDRKRLPMVFTGRRRTNVGFAGSGTPKPLKYRVLFVQTLHGREFSTSLFSREVLWFKRCDWNDEYACLRISHYSITIPDNNTHIRRLFLNILVESLEALDSVVYTPTA